VNYLLMKEYQIETNSPAKKPAGDEKTKAEAHRMETPAPSPVEALVKEGVAARYERKDTAAAERAWEQALLLLDQPGVAAIDRYQTCAGLGLIYGERKEHAKPRDFFKRAVDATGLSCPARSGTTASQFCRSVRGWSSRPSWRVTPPR
jgi:hypothetical protein